MLKDKSRKPSSEAQPAKVQELQKLTISELNAPREADLFEIAGGALSANHNETVVKLAHLSQKPKPSSEDKSVKVRELQTLTIAELDAIAGGALSLNHNETVVSLT